MTKDILFKGTKYTIHEFGYILSYKCGYFIDQLDGITEIFSKNFKEYLDKKYNISLEEYYCLIKFGKLDDERLYCPYCNSKRKFSGNLSNGYRSTCPSCNKVIKFIDNELTNDIVSIDGYFIISPGKIISKTHHKIYDQLDISKSSYLILNKNRNIDFELKRKYNITEEEYYNLIVNGDKNFRPKCKCGEYLEFRGVINGYHKLCNKCKGRNVPYKDITEIIEGFEIHYPGIIAKASHNKFINQINGKIYSNSNIMLKDIYKDYGLTEREYYNLVVYKDSNYQPICSRDGCNNKIPYRNFYEGYRNTCSTECTNLMRCSEDNSYDLYDPMNQYIIYSRFNKGKTSNLYITDVMDDPDHIKIGITINMEGRAHTENYINYRVLFTGDSEQVAWFEMLIKVRFIKYRGTGKYKTESFPRYLESDILNYINEIIK